MDTLFGEGQTGPKILLFLVVVLGLLAVAFWLLRRFGGGRLGSAAARGRQPRLALIDQAAIDNRRRLVLIRRDNVEHLLIIGGPTDVVVEQNIVRAAAAALAPARPAATDTLPRAVPLGEDTMWPLQPETAPKPEGAPRVEPSLRAEPAPRPSRPGAEEPMQWPGDAEAPAAPSVAPLPPAAPRKPRPVDPLAGLAEELSRIPPPPSEPAGLEPRQTARRAPRLPLSPAAPTDAAPPPSDQNLSEMAQRLEAALRRPPKSVDKPADKAGEKAEDAPLRRARLRAGSGGFRTAARLTAGGSATPAVQDRRYPRQPVRTKDCRRTHRGRDGGIRARASRAALRRHSAAPVQAR